MLAMGEQRTLWVWAEVEVFFPLAVFESVFFIGAFPGVTKVPCFLEARNKFLKTSKEHGTL